MFKLFEMALYSHEWNKKKIKIQTAITIKPHILNWKLKKIISSAKWWHCFDMSRWFGFNERGGKKIIEKSFRINNWR